MKTASPKTIWTIGHSTHTLEAFIAMLQYYEIQLLADIRSYPSSKRYPHFNQAALQASLKDFNIQYISMKALGGRRQALPHSHNDGWRLAAFRGYADYMETAEFKNGITALEQLALEKRTAYMCAEAVWWSCHRSLVSDYLKLKGWKVMHIMGTAKAMEHPYTAPARIVEGKLVYSKSE